ncbi:MAG: hypothetical protein V3U45_05245 [bacterium]
MALLWSFILFGIYSLLASAVGGGLSLIAPLVGFGAGALSIAGGILGVKRAELGALLVLAAGLAGLLAAVAPLLLGPQVEAPFFDFLIAYLAVSWWAILMVIVGGVTRIGLRRVAATSAESPSPPGHN